MLLFDKKLTAQEALECNLVSRIIPNDNFKVETERLVSEIFNLKFNY
jgi:enoyl-CoA hydratase/carnithine racemase